MGLIPGLERFPWSRKWQHTAVFLPEKFHGQRSLVGPWARKELLMTEWLMLSLSKGVMWVRYRTSQVVTVVKNLPDNAGGTRDMGSILGSERFPWSRKWQPTPVFLPGKSHEQRILVGYSPWGHKGSDMAKHTCIWVRQNSCGETRGPLKNCLSQKGEAVRTFMILREWC